MDTVYGAAAFNDRTIASYVREFVDAVLSVPGRPRPTVMRPLAQELHTFIRQRNTRGEVGPHFQLVGYTPGHHLPELYTIDTNQPDFDLGVVQGASPGITWGGVTDALDRMHRGIDSSLAYAIGIVMGEEMSAMGLAVVAQHYDRTLSIHGWCTCVRHSDQCRCNNTSRWISGDHRCKFSSTNLIAVCVCPPRSR